MTRLSPTAILRQVVATKCVRHNPETGNIGYDQYTAPDTVAVKPTCVASAFNYSTYPLIRTCI